MHIHIIFVYRLALLQEWREKYGPNATYRNLAKSFYDAGKPGLVETVCAVMTCDYRSENTSQNVTISLSRALPNATSLTRILSSSLACKCLLFCFVVMITVVLSVILALYTFDADNSQSGSYFASQSPSSASADRADTEGTEVGRIHYGHKTSEFAPNNFHLSVYLAKSFSYSLLGRIHACYHTAAIEERVMKFPSIHLDISFIKFSFSH